MRRGKVLLIAMLVLLVTVGAGGTQPQAINFLSQVNVSTPLPFTGTWPASGTINDSGTLSEPTVCGGPVSSDRLFGFLSEEIIQFVVVEAVEM
jgi:hypothetical protein